MNCADLPVPRIVLDTNVCLDLFVFREPRCAHLLAALRRGAVQAVTREDCRAEWRAVLRYPRLPVDDALRPSIEAAFDALTRLLPPGELAASDDARLPRCADPDDQKFLQLALAARASWLLSKDKALLKLDRRTRNAGLFRIQSPQHWVGVEG
ncbi:MAG: putative toxin-antitoxin system toxin component, PIN family [Xanthomonadaceae bacterium]|nr:putative toxin-antitoxin system toxin component, PIN family [Xanthomonadaceae bacterium]MDE3072889.1 putative toxin-antitoxin system toxin component, PIN family [Pseudomonadota bacterium]